MTKLALQIDGMHCPHCIKSVKAALEAVPGVTVNDVQLGSAHIESMSDPAPLKAITDAIEDAGYFAEVAG